MAGGSACGKISLDGGGTGTGLLKGVGALIVRNTLQSVIYLINTRIAMQNANTECQMRNSVASAVTRDEEHRNRRDVGMDACFTSTVEDKSSIKRDEACVLIVDDEVETTEEIACKLSTHGFSCFIAHDATSALQVFADEPCISIVISDIRMPGMVGVELCRLLKSRYEGKRDLALLMVTGHAGIDEAIEALKVGVLDFLTKPLQPHQLVHAVRRADEHVRFLTLERDFKNRCRQEVQNKTEEIAAKNRALMLANERLAHASQAKTQFLRLISHELNTPLNQILGFAEMMETDGDSHELTSELEYIKDAGFELHRKIGAILDMVALDAEEVELVISRTSVNTLISRVMNNCRSVFERSSLSVRQVLPDEECFIQADAGRLEQAMDYLIDNAVSFSSPGDKVSVIVACKSGTCSISVHDQGAGMTADEMHFALEPFNQVDNSLTRKHAGIGVGLTLARCFAELHGGSLSIDSTPGKGAAVTLELPCKAD